MDRKRGRFSQDVPGSDSVHKAAIGGSTLKLDRFEQPIAANYAGLEARKAPICRVMIGWATLTQRGVVALVVDR